MREQCCLLHSETFVMNTFEPQIIISTCSCKREECKSGPPDEFKGFIFGITFQNDKILYIDDLLRLIQMQLNINA